jgi:hypothetical protein
MYKARIQAWKLNKNMKSADMDVVLRHYPREELENKVKSGSDSALVVDGRSVSVSLVKRYLRRLRLSETPRDNSASYSEETRSEDAIFASPSASPTARNAPADKCERPATVDVWLPSPLHSLPSTPAVNSPHGMHLSSQKLGFLDFRVPSPSTISNGLHTTEKSYEDDDDDDEESDARRKRRKLIVPNVKSSLETRTLACPFYKHNPQRYNPQNKDMDLAMRYRTCAGPGWESISRLRYFAFVTQNIQLLTS